MTLKTELTPRHLFDKKRWFRPSKIVNNNHKSLLNKHMDYTRRCDKCENWIPMHQSNHPLDPVEWDGNYCTHADHHYTTSKYVGYSKMVEQLIEDLMARFVYEAYGEQEFIRAVTFCANMCPIYKEEKVKKCQKTEILF